jgi:hypothetical protein
MDEGWDLASQRETIARQREQAVAAFEKDLAPVDMPAFRRRI